jgi:hypothetical protein
LKVKQVSIIYLERKGCNTGDEKERSTTEFVMATRLDSVVQYSTPQGDLQHFTGLVEEKTLISSA